MKASSVYYDAQKNKYMRVDKETGQTSQVHKNGSDFKRFKPEYSGSNFEARKHSLSPPSLTRPPFRVKIQSKMKPAKNYQSQSVRKFDQKTKLHQLKSLQTQRKSDDITQKLKQFSNYKQKLINQNHSQNKFIQGSILTQKFDKPIGTIHFDNSTHGIKPSKKNNKSASLFKMDEIPENLVIKNQMKREHHKNFEKQLEEPQDKDRVERRSNMLLLERLQLQKNQRMTNHVYE